jgi:saccharopine dehydrogenase (NADP+, L-glutamate forming)
MSFTTLHNVLALGSGLIAGPCLEYLSRNPHNRITIGSFPLTQSSLATPLKPPVSRTLDQHTPRHHIVTLLLPFSCHVAVLRAAIKSRTHIVTTRYVSDATRAPNADAQRAGITVLNEVGVDPGNDHVYAVCKIADIHARGGLVREFHSYCGGLSAPECNGNPLGSKFNWSPRGALRSQGNSAIYLKNGVVETISSENLMASAVPYFAKDGYEFVVYPNRNSVPLQEFYDMPEAHTVVRGSLRYQGNPALVQALVDVGCLGQERKEWMEDGMTWGKSHIVCSMRRGVTRRTLPSLPSDTRVLTPHSTLITTLHSQVAFENATEADSIIAGVRWMRLFSDEKATVTGSNPLDTLSAHLAAILVFAPGERNPVMLQHEFVIEWPDNILVFPISLSLSPSHPSLLFSGFGRETHTTTLGLFGTPQGASAMARSVRHHVRACDAVGIRWA